MDRSEDVKAAAFKHEELLALGVDVILDDRGDALARCLPMGADWRATPLTMATKA
jgi:hypothetical protein